MAGMLHQVSGNGLRRRIIIRHGPGLPGHCPSSSMSASLPLSRVPANGSHANSNSHPPGRFFRCPSASLFEPAHKGGVHMGFRARLEAAGVLTTICDGSQDYVIVLSSSRLRDSYQRVTGAAGEHQQKRPGERGWGGTYSSGPVKNVMRGSSDGKRHWTAGLLAFRLEFLFHEWMEEGQIRGFPALLQKRLPASLNPASPADSPEGPEPGKGK